MPRVQSRSWVWRFDHPPERVWPLMADTQRFNEAAALPKYDMEELPQPDGSVHYFGSTKLGPFRLRWREIPVNWVAFEWFEHRRIFDNGPFRSLIAQLQLAQDGAGSSLRYTLSVEPANLVGAVLLLAGFFTSTERNFRRLSADANAYLSGLRDRPFHYQPPAAAKETLARVQSLVNAVEATPYGHGLAGRLAEYVLTAQEVDLWRIRPLALAREWSAPSVDVIELCLQAVRLGLLDLRWDLLCPRCRVAKAWSGGLDQLPKGAHCPSCNIDYDRDFARNVEASFHPAPGIRPLESGEYCMWGPMSVPHVKAQIALRPGEEKSVPARLPYGPYRLRSLEPGPEATIDWRGGAFPAVLLGEGSITAGEPARPGYLAFRNSANRPLTAVIEDRRWVQDALTGERVTTLQGFRDLFSHDVLRPGDEVAVGRVALLFSDLKGSTALYQRIGDASAYHLVREHFALLTQSVRRHEGGVVKTIGDAVMAAFVDASHAVAAAIEILRRVDAFNREQENVDPDGPRIVIKLGVHVGPAIAVNLNDRLDYFGSTVNLAARLQSLAQGGEIVLSAETMTEPGIEDQVSGLVLEKSLASLKGFRDDIPVHRCRISN